MTRFLVSYDLMTPGRDYSRLTAALTALGGTRVLFSQWVLRSSMTAEKLRDHLMQFMDLNDRVLVNELTNNWASFKALIDINKAA